jgi:hypothetical protein
MLLCFEVAGEPVEFHRNWFTGRSELRVRDTVFPLQSPWDLTTHFNMSLTKVWKQRLGNHDVVIEHVRPLLFAGVRPHTYRVLVDGTAVAEQRGY